MLLLLPQMLSLVAFSLDRQVLSQVNFLLLPQVLPRMAFLGLQV